MSEEQGSYNLVVGFPDGSPSFVHGFQAGQIWECMARGDPSMALTVRLDNEEVIRRMAAAKGYDVKWEALEPIEHGWASASLSLAEAPSATDKARAIGFSVVKGDKP